MGIKGHALKVEIYFNQSRSYPYQYNLVYIGDGTGLSKDSAQTTLTLLSGVGERL